MKHIKEYTEFLNEELPTKEIDPGKFFNPGPKNDKGYFMKGKGDGNPTDDIVQTRAASIPAKSLKPSQDAVYLGKALGMAISGVEGGRLEAVISSDNRILDGHHRWAATMFNNPSAKISGAQAELSIGDLVPVLRQAGDAIGNDRGSAPAGGDVNIFTATIDDVEDAIYKGANMDPEYYDKDKAIEWYEGKGKDIIAKRLKMLQRVDPPPGAPSRADMPKIKPEQVKKISKHLQAGGIDVRAPYND